MTLPLEILEQCMDRAAESRKTLANCSLVCKSWLPRSRHHLFNIVDVDHRNHRAFHTLLSSPYTTIPVHVKSIVLFNNRKQFISSWLDDCLPSLVQLPSVTALSIQRFHFDMSPPKALLDIPRILFRVTQLELDSLSFKDFPQLASLLGGFPKLKKFAASNLGWPDFALPSVDVCLPPILDAIFLGKCYKRDILDWMLTSKIVPTCRSLTLNPVGPMDTPSIGQYLEALGDELKELDVGFTSLDSGGDAEDFYANIDLSYNPCIEKIRIQELISGVQYRLSSPLPWILKSLSRLHPNTLKDVSFTIFLDSIEDLDPEDEPIEWDVMDELLCTRPLFSALQNVTFVVLGSLPLFLVKMVLQFRLPGIFRRDLLKVVDSNGETLV